MLPIAVQLYSLRNVQMPFDELLGKVAEIGYTGVETVGNHNLSIDEMKALLEKHGLKAVSAHVPITAMEADLEGVIAFHKGIGNDTIMVPFLAPDDRAKDSAGWSALGKRLDTIGQRCRDAGMRLLYHNHAFEMESIEGKLAIDWLMEGASATNVGFEIDLAWVVRGGQDGVAMIQKYSGRCPRVHCKDLAPAGENEDQMGFADVGHGTLDWSLLLPAAKAAGAEWYVVEHDLPKEPLVSIRRSFDFLKGQLG
ncbi:MAG: sugar phosphate isomerase/epimerase [Caldilineaceae bacterium]|nr:sugar phosphate isomerase/epimerase [Caldilineaceae bacterium]